MTTHAILEEPRFLSAPIREYLHETAELVGRYIVFCDGDKADSIISGAHIETGPDLPAAAIFLRKSLYNPNNYNPTIHDPVVAHEITHLLLWAEGWSMINIKNFSLEARELVNAVHNWLTDPIINQRIVKRGFSMKNDRTQEIKRCITSLQQHRWSNGMAAKLMKEIYAVRFYVSFALEPQISKHVKTSFQKAFRSDLPHLYPRADLLLELIETNGFDTPEKYKYTSLLCLKELGLDPLQIYFGEPFQYFTAQEREAWALENDPFEERESWA